jgi:hypothetical protein
VAEPHGPAAPRAPHEQHWAVGRRIGSLASLAVLAMAFARPAPALADAVWTGDPGGMGAPGLLAQLFALAQVVVGLGAAIAVLVVLGFAVARIGGRPSRSVATPGVEGRGAASSHLGRNVSVLLAAGAAVFGIGAGRAIAYEESRGELSILTAWLMGVLLGGLVIGLIVIGLVALGVRRGHASRAIATVFASAGLLVAGAYGGGLTAGALGGTYREPIVSQAPAEVRIRLAATSLPFAAQDGGQAECRSVPDSRAVSSVSGLDLGELGPGTLRVGFTLGTAGSGTADTELFIDAGDLPEGSPLVSWTGTVVVAGTNADGSAGQLTFSNLALSSGDGKPAPESAPPPSATVWPATLSGTLTWMCQAWSAAQPPNMGSVMFETTVEG